MYFGCVLAPFRPSKENELSIDINDIVIVRTIDLSGWCYAETLDGKTGYIPFLYVDAILPKEEYTPAWKSVVKLRSVYPMSRESVREIRKDLVAVQRRSIIKAQRPSVVVRSKYRIEI